MYDSLLEEVEMPVVPPMCQQVVWASLCPHSILPSP